MERADSAESSAGQQEGTTTGTEGGESLETPQRCGKMGQRHIQANKPESVCTDTALGLRGTWGRMGSSRLIPRPQSWSGHRSWFSAHLHQPDPVPTPAGNFLGRAGQNHPENKGQLLKAPQVLGGLHHQMAEGRNWTSENTPRGTTHPCQLCRCVNHWQTLKQLLSPSLRVLDANKRQEPGFCL